MNSTQNSSPRNMSGGSENLSKPKSSKIWSKSSPRPYGFPIVKPMGFYYDPVCDFEARYLGPEAKSQKSLLQIFLDSIEVYSPKFLARYDHFEG